MKSKNFLNLLVFFVIISILIAGCKSQDKETITETTEEAIDTGALLVESSPGLAQVYVGEEYRGDTPLNLYNLPVGNYAITIKKAGYADFKKSITIKVGRTAEIDVTLTQIVEETKPKEEPKETEKQSEPNILPTPKLNKINLTGFSLYYDFDKIEFTEIRTVASDIFSRKYDTYVHFTALTPTKIYLLNKPISEVTKEDCIFSDTAVASLFSAQTLCVKTGSGNVVAVGGIWQTMPNELEWRQLD